MAWHIDLELTDRDRLLEVIPSILQQNTHTNHTKNYRIQWQFSRLEYLEIIKSNWSFQGTIVTQGFINKVSFLFHNGYHRFRMLGHEIVDNGKYIMIGHKRGEAKIEHSPFHSVIIHVDEAVFMRELSRYLDRPIATLKTEYYLDRNSAYGTSLWQLVQTLCHLIETDGHPLAIGNMETAILSMLVQGSFHNYSQTLQKPTPEASSQRAKQAADYIQAHLSQKVTLADLAEATHCSSRSLQTAFNRHYGCSPHEFLRKCRLEAAYSELTKGRVTVTEVAFKYGFSNPGLFTKYFSTQFGKRPSDILRSQALSRPILNE